MKLKIFHFSVLAAVLLAAVYLHGCGYRAETAPLASNAPAAAETTPAPTEAPVYTVEYRLGDSILQSESVPFGGAPAAAAVLPEGLFLVAWTDKTGERVDPAAEPVEADTVYYALARPVLNSNAAFLFPDEYGLLRPESTMTRGECAAALRALAPEEFPDYALPALPDAEGDGPLTREEFKAVLEALFDPEAVGPVLAALPETESENATRAEFAYGVSRLLGKENAAEDVYYPDVPPAHWASAELLAAAGSGTLTKESLESMARDGFLWFGGYLYRLGEDGFFLTDEESDGLYFDKNGRYTSGSAELDDYVAQTLSDFMTPGAARLDDLKAVYYHVKNDFQYLTRNYYDSGATGWDIDEALTIFRTNKGNCYCYAGAFCALARGLGYNARTYSGSIGIENQPHAWTEITLDGKIYICDPEIEMNYWLLQMYTDNFMMLRENSLGWNYQAVGRT